MMCAHPIRIRRDAKLRRNHFSPEARDELSGELRTQQNDALSEGSPVLTQDYNPQF